jgi:hypothetical protein
MSAMQLWPCTGCSRHLKRSDARCPFCGVAVSARSEPTPTRTAAGRLSRAALFAAGAMGAAVTTTDCGGPAIQPPYGGAPVQPTDGGSVAIESQDSAAADSGDASVATEPPDSSTAAADAPNMEDVPMAVAAYGGAIIVDSGGTESDDAPSFVALYGGFAPVDGGLKGH